MSSLAGISIHPCSSLWFQSHKWFYKVDLLDIGAAGEIQTVSNSGSLLVKAKLTSGQCYGCGDTISLRFDRDSQNLAIESPIAANVALFKYLQSSARSFNN
jgi:hypothetical protein